MDMGIGASLLQIAWVNIVLSGDNAMVIALACRSLQGRDRWLGIVLGAGAAVVLRIIFTVGLSEMMLLPFVRALAGLLLIYIAVKLLTADDQSDQHVEGHRSLLRAMGAIIIADIIMSLDNVVAIAAAAHGSILLIVLGLAISVPIVVFGSTLVVEVIRRFPWIVWAGSAFLGWIAGETFFSDSVVQRFSPPAAATVVAGIVGGIIVVVLGWQMRPAQRKSAG